MHYSFPLGRCATLIGLLATAPACSNLDRFDTGTEEAYCGSIIGEDFVLEGLASNLELELSIDTGRLESRPGRITSRDAEGGPCAPEPLFDDAQLRTSSKIQADPLSTLDFGTGREHNFFAWADSSCQGTFLNVVSLMHDGNVELRLLKPGGDDEGPAFGVFALERMTLEECAELE